MRPGARFAPGAVRPAGHIFYLAPEERPTDDPKTRPHFLVNRCDVAADPAVMATLAHMTTKPTEHAAYGCSVHEIEDPVRVRHGVVYVLGARLVPCDPDWLTVSGRSAVREVRPVREMVLEAIGLGEGVADSASKSVRGRLVRIHDSRLDIRHGCVLTSHAYSANRRYQIIVPVFDRILHGPEGPEPLEPTRWDVIPQRKPWWHALPLEEPVFDTAGLISLSELWRRDRDPRRWLKPQIEIIDALIDDATLAAVEEKIVERLQQ
jgi:hypothetical protein